MTSSSPTVATTSDSHSAPDDLAFVEISNAGSENMTLATTAPMQPPIVWHAMYNTATRPTDRAEPPIDERHDGIEVGARYRSEHQDQPDQRAGCCRGILEELQPDVVRRQVGRHDPRADDRDDQEPGTERLGGQAAGQVKMQLSGPRLDHGCEFAAIGCHDRSRRHTRSRGQNGDALAKFRNGGIERISLARPDRIGDRPVQPGVVRPEFLVGLIAHGHDQWWCAHRSRQASEASRHSSRARSGPQR